MSDHFSGGNLKTAAKLKILEWYLEQYVNIIEKYWDDYWYVDTHAGTGRTECDNEVLIDAHLYGQSRITPSIMTLPTNILENLALDKWFKAVTYVGIIILFFSLFIPTQVITNELIAVFGAGMFIFGLADGRTTRLPQAYSLEL